MCMCTREDKNGIAKEDIQFLSEWLKPPCETSKLSGSVLLQWFLVPLGVLFVMKTLEDEQ